MAMEAEVVEEMVVMAAEVEDVVGYSDTSLDTTALRSMRDWTPRPRFARFDFDWIPKEMICQDIGVESVKVYDSYDQD